MLIDKQTYTRSLGVFLNDNCYQDNCYVFYFMMKKLFFIKTITHYLAFADGQQRWIVPVAAIAGIWFVGALVAGIVLLKLRKRRKRYFRSK